ncbi:MAG: NUDIX domain-containing protein [Verrucomicrobiota bacterium]|nr:NUDIX domain-containing protein [Verrucomicrobiota bacterium]
MERHFTATVFIFHKTQVLLHRHPKLERWLPPGGHMEANETPPMAARREVKEETGLDITFIQDERLNIEACNAVSFERPFLCLLEHVPAIKDRAAHQHMDLIYLAIPANEEQIAAIPLEFQWFSWEKIEKIEQDLFPDTLQVLELLLKKKITTVDGAFPSRPLPHFSPPYHHTT